MEWDWALLRDLKDTLTLHSFIIEIFTHTDFSLSKFVLMEHFVLHESQESILIILFFFLALWC